MDIADRAKQFAPFAALTGMGETLAAKEKIKVEKITLTEETEAELNLALTMLRRGDMVSVVHYKNEEYIRTDGILAKIDKDLRFIQVVTERIEFDNLLKVEKI